MDSIFRRAVLVVLAGVMMLAMVGCAGEPLTTREKATALGGGIGAASGAIIGAALGSPGAGAAIGGALGAGTGFIAGNELQNHEVHEKQIEEQLQAQQAEIEHQRRTIEKLMHERETAQND